MKKAIAAGFLLATMSVGSAFAAENCKPIIAQKKEFKLTKDDKQAALALKNYLDATVNKDLCQDHTITTKVDMGFVGVGAFLKVEVGVSRICKTQEDQKNYGCGINPDTKKKQISATACTSIDPYYNKGSVGVVMASKCDPRTGKKISELFASADSVNRMAQILSPLNSWQEVKTAPLSIPNSGSITADQLAGKLDIPVAEAQSALEKSPDKVNALLAALESNNKASIQEKTADLNQAAGLNIDGDKLVAQASRLASAEKDGELPANATPANKPENPDGTFGEPPAPAAKDRPDGPKPQCGMEGENLTAGLFMRAESLCNRSPISTTGCAGPYHYCESTWKRDACATIGCQYADPSNRFNVDLATKVLNVKNDQYLQKYGDEWTRLGIPEHVGLYACHVMGEGGCGSLTRAYAANPNASAEVLREALGRCGNSYCYDINGSIYRGRDLNGVMAELDRRMTGGTTLGLYGGVSIVQGSDIVNRSIGSPFGNLNPTASWYPVGQAPSYTTPAPILPAQSLPVTPTLPTAPIQTTITTAPPVPAVATLIANPQTISRGGAITFTWSSVGVLRGVPCVFTQESPNKVKLAEANEGTFRFITATTSTASSYSFALRCYAATDAHMIQRDVTVTIQ